MKPINVALIGTGFIGPVHAEALRRLGIPFSGVLGSSEAASRRAADALGIPRAYRTYDEVLADPAVRAVHITAPNRLHVTMAKRALEAGKHVMCEKPLGMTSAETAELVAVAKRSRVAAGVTYNIRFYPQVAEARERVRAGAVGDVVSIVGSYVQDWLLYPTDYNWRVLAEQGGALRAIADIGTHWLDLAQHIVGKEVQAVCADLHTVHPVRERPLGEVQTFSGKEAERPAATEKVPITTDDLGAVLLRFRGGARGMLWVSQVTAGRKNCVRFELGGTRASLAWDSESPETMWIGHRDQPNQLLMRDPGLLTPGARALTGHPGGHAEGFADTFKQCFRAFYDDIETGRFATAPTYPTFEDGHRELLLCEAIERSHREGRWIEIGGHS
jgi:predicted dehydrogenase